MPGPLLATPFDRSCTAGQPRNRSGPHLTLRDVGRARPDLLLLELEVRLRGSGRAAQRVDLLLRCAVAALAEPDLVLALVHALEPVLAGLGRPRLVDHIALPI